MSLVASVQAKYNVLTSYQYQTRISTAATNHCLFAWEMETASQPNVAVSIVFCERLYIYCAVNVIIITLQYVWPILCWFFPCMVIKSIAIPQMLMISRLTSSTKYLSSLYTDLVKKILHFAYTL